MEDERISRRPRSLMDEKMMAVALMELRYSFLRGLSAEEIIRRTSSSSSSSSSAKLAQKKPMAAALMELSYPSLHGIPAEETIRPPSSTSTDAKINLKKPTVAAKTTTTTSSGRYPTIKIKFGQKSPASSPDHSGENKLTKMRIKSHKPKQELSEQAKNPSSSLQPPVPTKPIPNLKKFCHNASTRNSGSPPRPDRLLELIVPRERRTARPRAKMISSMTSHKRKSPSSSSEEEAPSKKRADSSSPSTVLHLRSGSSSSSNTCLYGGFVVDENRKPSLAEVRPIESVQEHENKNESPLVHSPKTVKFSFDLNEPWIGDKEDDD